MTNTDKVLYTAKVHTAGGRESAFSHSDDGRLKIKLSAPGTSGTGTNPEQLFAAGWSACFEGAMGIPARRMRVKLPAETSIDAEVDICHGEDGYSLRARLNVSLPGLEREVARELTESAHQTCPYSKAVHRNIYVEINLV